ncbi:NmrA family NAD(P)-binding protein [Streptomyces montanisoli]|uniref:NmrA family NAD(P)-binding protein n=1 Tax=Streptomyces montanisoli TaxID=2798581 RepID=A0A940RW80_9ACTN|nr:NmrA family NAD(P)-binding protein [Streptomyces montanisoli]MBP0456339.1 NmrA family NAD(P)-binding protein [Streptomyces montanisoli]
MTATPTAATLVIGATGTTGSRVAARLTAAGHRVKAASRGAGPGTGVEAEAEAVRFDWYDPATHAAALDGVDRVHLTPPVGDFDPAQVMLPFLRRARDTGVRRAVLLSSSAVASGGPAVGAVHEALPGLFDEWAVLRPSWFMQNFTGSHVHARGIREHGTITTATGAGRVAFVDADDIAAVAVQALTADRALNTDLVLTGPRALSHDDIAAIMTEATGRRVVHRHVTHEQLRERLAAEVPRDFAAMLADMERSIAEGAEDRTSDAVERVTGRPPHSFRTVVEREWDRQQGRTGTPSS